MENWLNNEFLDKHQKFHTLILSTIKLNVNKFKKMINRTQDQ